MFQKQTEIGLQLILTFDYFKCEDPQKKKANHKIHGSGSTIKTEWCGEGCSLRQDFYPYMGIHMIVALKGKT